MKKNRKSKIRIIESDDEESSEPETKFKKNNDGSRRVSRRSSIRNSRKNTPEPVSNRRSIKKEEKTDRRSKSKRSLDNNFNMINLTTLIDEIIKHNESWPFIKPVSPSEVPDYLEVIKKPMDFSKIKSKLNLGDYQSNEQTMKDVERVFFNCDLYNLSNTEIYK